MTGEATPEASSDSQDNEFSVEAQELYADVFFGENGLKELRGAIRLRHAGGHGEGARENFNAQLMAERIQPHIEAALEDCEDLPHGLDLNEHRDTYSFDYSFKQGVLLAWMRTQFGRSGFKGMLHGARERGLVKDEVVEDDKTDEK